KHAAEKEDSGAFNGYGFLDNHVGGLSIVRRMQAYLEDGQVKDDLSAKEIFQMSIEGNEKALKAINDMISHLAFSLVNVISVLNPECIVLGGGISKSIEHFLPKIQHIMMKHVP